MPGILDDLVTPELAGMVGHHLVIEQHHDALGMRAHQHHPPGRPGVDAVTVMIRQVVVARTAFSTKPSKGPRSSIRLARSSWKTSQIVRSLNSGCLVRRA